MTKRPKLSLSPDNQVNKKQASGFQEATPGQKPEVAQVVASPSSKNRESPSPKKEGDSPVPSDDVWNGAKVVKAVLAIAVAALSLYLLKRRLM